MRVLVLGGSVFLGRAVVGEARALGADVSVFNRGSTPAPDGVEQLVGDRTGDLAPLHGRRFDVVVDTSGYVPAVVGRSAETLSSSGHYSFVSSISVYPGWPEAADYRAAVHDGDPAAAEGPDGAAAYGWLKAGCEHAVSRVFGERCSNLRAGCIVGPHDTAVGRLPWWLDRVGHGGEVLVPGAPEDPIALLDARDLARYALAAVPGTVEATGPRATRAELMAACRTATGADATFTYVADDWLAARPVEAWTELPLWVPGAPGLFVHAPAPAGLALRPLADTVRDTWAWQCSADWRPSTNTPGLAATKERDLLAAWHAR